jgi:hypothetical protein
MWQTSSPLTLHRQQTTPSAPSIQREPTQSIEDGTRHVRPPRRNWTLLVKNLRRNDSRALSRRTPATRRRHHLQPLPAQALAPEPREHDSDSDQIRLHIPTRAVMASHAAYFAAYHVSQHDLVVHTFPLFNICVYYSLTPAQVHQARQLRLAAPALHWSRAHGCDSRTLR